MRHEDECKMKGQVGQLRCRSSIRATPNTTGVLHPGFMLVSHCIGSWQHTILGRRGDTARCVDHEESHSRRVDACGNGCRFAVQLLASSVGASPRCHDRPGIACRLQSVAVRGLGVAERCSASDANHPSVAGLTRGSCESIDVTIAVLCVRATAGNPGDGQSISSQPHKQSTHRQPKPGWSQTGRSGVRQFRVRRG